MPKIRVRHAAGSAAIEIPPRSTNEDVSKLIEGRLPSLAATKQVWKIGFPPKKVTCSPRDPFEINEVIHVSDTRDGEDPSVASATAGFSIVIPQTPPQRTDPDGFLVKRVIPADNSCLFNSIGYSLLNKSLEYPRRLRDQVAKAVIENPGYYTEAFLGRPPADYIDFITTPSAWGGQIELLVFSKLFECEIVACDIVRNQVDIYGQEGNYVRRIYVMYDGAHYDCLAYTFDTNLPKDADVTQFAVDDDWVLQHAKQMCREQHAQKAYTDISNFTLRCLVCQKGFTGAMEAQQHAEATGHANFAEY